jgi:regulator of protease activity HflC (stomatin/prohibitin superfamily)
MQVLIWFVVVTMLLLAAAIAIPLVAFHVSEDGAYDKKTKASKKALIVALISAAAVGISCASFLIPSHLAVVGANEVGIVINDFNGVQDWTYGEGVHQKSMFDHVYCVSTSNRSSKIETYSQTSDGQSAQFEISIIYNISKADAGKFFRKTNSNGIDDSQLNTIVKQNLQTSTSVYNIFDLLSEGLETARVAFETNLKKSLSDEYYITLTKASFDDIDAGDEVEAILKKKAEADQEIEIAKKEAEAAQIKAASDAQIQKTLADAEAYATTVKGKASGDAASAYIKSVQSMVNRLYCSINGVAEADIAVDKDGYVTSFKPVESSKETMSYSKCADLILGIIFYDTWDGKLPEVLTNDELSAMIGALIANGGASASGSSSSSAPSSSSQSNP